MKRCLWLGLAYKRAADGGAMRAFDERSPSGKLVHAIANGVQHCHHVFDNMVDYVPEDEDGNERAPDKKDFEACWSRFLARLRKNSPDIVFVFGDALAKYFERKSGGKILKYQPFLFRGSVFIFCDHPSYINVYRRKHVDEYVGKVQALAA